MRVGLRDVLLTQEDMLRLLGTPARRGVVEGRAMGEDDEAWDGEGWSDGEGDECIVIAMPL